MADSDGDVSRAIEDYLARLDAGEATDVADLIESYPHLADQLHAFFDIEDVVRQAAAYARTKPTASGDTHAAVETKPDVPGFEVHEIIGRGGMGTVYRATNTRTEAEVALKVLPPAFAADAASVSRFKQEARVASRLTEAHILPVHDLLHDSACPVLVMSYVDGWDLGRIVRQRIAANRGDTAEQSHPWARADDQQYVEHILQLFDQMASAIVAIHEAGILHRDVKPSNILVGPQGDAWLTDFGLARVGEGSQMTAAGDVFGTAGFISPEQAAGDPDAVDARSDLFSLGVTIYQSLTLELPYGTRPINRFEPTPRRPSQLQPLISDYDPVILKLLEPDPRNRYESSREFREDWQRVRQGMLATAARPGRIKRVARWLRRNRVVSASVGIVVFTILLSVFLLTRPENSDLAKPGIELPTVTMSKNSNPEKPGLELQTVTMTTNPTGAKLYFIPLSTTTGEPQPKDLVKAPGTSPITVKLPPGDYLVVAVLKNHGFIEVYRHVPDAEEVLGLPGAYRHKRWKPPQPSGLIELSNIERIPLDTDVEGMALFEGSDDFSIGSDKLPEAPRHRRRIPAFYLDPTEFTVADYEKQVLKGEEWAGFGQCFGNKPPLDFPVSCIKWDAAVVAAEIVGKRLPTEAELEFAGTDRGRRPFVWDKRGVDEWPYGPAGKPVYDRVIPNAGPPVFGLYSNVAEWTMSWHTPYPNQPAGSGHPGAERVIRGGPVSVAMGKPDGNMWRRGARQRVGIAPARKLLGLGFRCARSVRPRLTPEDFGQINQ
jgi:serine/threonine protein kinase